MELFTEVLQYVLILGSLFLFVFFVSVLLWIQHRNNKREAAELKKKVQDAIEKIMADGRVEGPKGSYVPHERRGAMTDGSTKPAKNPGYYHHPWR